MSRALTAIALALLVMGCGRSEQQQPPAKPQRLPLPVIPVDRTAVAIHAATRSAKEDAFYAATKWAPQWNADTIAQLERVIGDRRAHALDRMAFATGDSPAGTGREAADVARTRAALAYAGALASGAVDPKKVHGIYTLTRPAPDLAAGLAKALAERQVDTWIESLAPHDAAYRALAAAYQNGGGSGGAAIPALDAPLAPDATDERIRPIARQLVVFGYLSAAEADTDTLTAAIADAVRRLQTDYGQTADGVLRPETVAVLSYTPRDRSGAIAVAMERLRWMERDPAPTRIDVNIAAARLTYWRDGLIADQRNVVVGAPETKTPQLLAPMFRLVANPTWTIPPSIVRKDRMAARSAASLARSGMRWSNGRIVQAAGPRNSLGQVKFDLHDPYAIYLHDTPAKALFAAAERHRSHGCVRVKDALGFADMIAADAGVAQSWAKARAGGRTVFIPLPKQIPVRLFYATVLLGANDAPIVRGDPYGWDAPIAKRLGFGGRAKPVLETKAVDSGP